jgi:hypothetical protein
MSNEQKSENRNVVILIILTIIWFGFFLHNNITISNNYSQLKQIVDITITNHLEIVHNQQLILNIQREIITNQYSIAYDEHLILDEHKKIFSILQSVNYSVTKK